MLALIECFGDLPSEDGVDGADDDQDNGVEEGDHVGRVNIRVAHQHVILTRGVVEHGAGWRNNHPYYHYQHLRTNTWTVSGENTKVEAIEKSGIPV